MANKDYMDNADFKKWLKQNGIDTDALKAEVDANNFTNLDKHVHSFETSNFETEKTNQEADNYLNFSDHITTGKPGHELDAYYKDWCEKEHQPPLIYENTNEASPAYGMKYYKTQEDKAAGKAAARIVYHDNKNVEVEGINGKAPDYEVLDALVRKAVLDGQPGIKFDDDMSPEFANKLAAACIKYGMKMKGQPEKIDVNEFAMALTPEQKANIDNYNAGQKPVMDKYSQKVVVAKDFAAHGIKELDVSRYKDAGEQAAWTAANREAGVTPKGAKSFYHLSEEKTKALPDAAKAQLKTYNRENVEKLYNAAKKMAESYKQANPGKDFDLSQSQYKDPKSAALVYAAYTAVGVTVTGMDQVNQNTRGRFETNTQGFMPQEAKDIIASYNESVSRPLLDKERKDKQDASDKEYNDLQTKTSLTADEQKFMDDYEKREQYKQDREAMRALRNTYRDPKDPYAVDKDKLEKDAGYKKIHDALIAYRHPGRP